MSRPALRFVVLFAACTLSLLPGDALRADEAADLKGLIRKAINALGGEEKLAKKPAVTTKESGTFSGMGAAVPFSGTFASHLPHRMRMEVADAFTMVVDGDRGWIETMGMATDMSKEQVDEQREVLHSDWVITLIPILREKDFELKALSDTKVDGKPATGVKVARKGHRDVSLYFDAKSALLLKAEYILKADEQGGKEVTQEIVFGKYEEVDGIQMSRHNVVRRDGQPFVEAHVDEVTRAEKLDDSLFKRP